MSEKIILEHKFSSEIPLTPEQLQAQQDEYDQFTNPNVEDVDFVAERDAYLARHGSAVNEADVEHDFTAE